MTLALPITISPAVITVEGGTKLTLVGVVGTFNLTDTYNVHIGPNGDSTDPACYAGATLGESIKPTSDTQIECGTPILEDGTLPKVFIVNENNGADFVVVDLALTVIERSYSTRLFSIRRLFAPNRSVGAREMSLLPAVNEPKQYLVKTGGQFGGWELPEWSQLQAQPDTGEQDPLGGERGIILQEDNTAASVHRIGQSLSLPTPSLVAGRPYTIAVCSKEHDRKWATLVVNKNGSETFNHTYDVQAGVLGQFIAGTGTPQIKAVDLASGWFRISLTFIPSNSGPYDFFFGAAESVSSDVYDGLDQDTIRFAFPFVDAYPLPRVFRGTDEDPIV